MVVYSTHITQLRDYIEWADLFTKVIHGYSGTNKSAQARRPVLFRGQGQEKWPPRPSIGRKKNMSELANVEEDEKLALAKFHQKLYAFRNPPPSGINLMAIAQHYKLRTRLLDWSDSALVALWFAVSGDSKGDNSVVYALSLPQDDHWLRRAYDGTVIDGETDDPLHDDFKWGDGIIGHAPDALSPRIVNQQGFFTIHENPIADMTKLRLGEIKMAAAIIDVRNRDKIRQKLSKFGFHERRIYPDLEGLAKHVDYEVFSQ